MGDTSYSVSWDELLSSLDTAAKHPVDSAWTIYQYLSRNIGSLTSEQARTLLAIYMRLPVERPSLVHSCMLGVAVKMSEKFADFRFPQFLKLWGFADNLREEDRQRQTGKDGRHYLALKERVERRLQSYMLHHSESRKAGEGMIKTMFAVKVFEKERNGRKVRFVKLVASDGMALVADSHQFPCKPWEIQGGLYDVSVVVSVQGVERVGEIVVSKNSVADEFSTLTGYVEGIDEGHNHYHIYDIMSRHYVAENPGIKPQVGDFVVFSPIVPATDKFKSAAVVSVLSHEEGRDSFGMYRAEVTAVDSEKLRIRYRITSPIPHTPEGVIEAEGSTWLTNVTDRNVLKSLSVGSKLRLVLFLKRGKDGVKRNYVTEICDA